MVMSTSVKTTVVIYTIKNKIKIRSSDGLLDFNIIEKVTSKGS